MGKQRGISTIECAQQTVEATTVRLVDMVMVIPVDVQASSLKISGSTRQLHSKQQQLAGQAVQEGEEEEGREESEKGQEERKKERGDEAERVRGKESEEDVEEGGQQKAEKIDQDARD